MVMTLSLLVGELLCGLALSQSVVVERGIKIASSYYAEVQQVIRVDGETAVDSLVRTWDDSIAQGSHRYVTVASEGDS